LRNAAMLFAVRRNCCICSIYYAVRRSQGLSVYLSHRLCAWQFTRDALHISICHRSIAVSSSRNCSTPR
jgi:hypothetical protein